MSRTISKTSSVVMATMLAFSGCFQPMQASEPGDPGILWSVDWSADGESIAVGGEWIRLFDAKSYELRRSPSLEGARAVKVRWHPRRSFLALSGGSDGETAIYDPSTDQKVVLKTKEGTRGIAWNSTGELLATAGNDGSLQIWTEDGKLQHTARQEKAKSMTGVAWHPTENKVVMIGEFITLYDGEGTIIKQVRHRPDAKGFCLLLCVEWHPSGEFFVIGDYGNHDVGDLPVLQFWSSDGKLLKTITAVNPTPFRNISWNRDGSLLASASDALRIWSQEGELRHTGDSPDALWGIRWNPEGDRLLTSSIKGRVTLWSASAKPSRNLVEIKAE